MSAAGPEAPIPAESLAEMAAGLLALAPEALGGLWLRAPAGPAREAWLARLRQLAPGTMPFRRMPAGIGEARLQGGLDLAATLAAGRPIAERGLLAEADGGLLLISMAERLEPRFAALVVATLESGMVRTERDGLALAHPARFGVVALDEGIDDEAPPAILTEHLALCLDLTVTPLGEACLGPERIAAARMRFSAVTTSATLIARLCEAAARLGISSLRASLQALAAARALAALAGRGETNDQDAMGAIALVLAPRARILPENLSKSPPESETQDEPSEVEPPPDSEAKAMGDAQPQANPPEEIPVEALLAALPPGLLGKIAARAMGRVRQTGRAGAAARAQARGRAIGTRQGDPRTGARISIVDTLRAAAPWQAIRRGRAAAASFGPLAIRREDFRITRTKARTRTTTLFVVDASGSSAMQRLGEAKGAVQILLSECYVRRDEVALLAFRGRQAELVLPPTRALARASRALAGLVGGGGTPLASAIDAARRLTLSILRGGRSVMLVFMTDGRANIGREGQPGRAQALADAEAAARELAGLNQNMIVIDTAVKPGEQALALARAMGARYVPLPYADARAVVDVLGAGRPARAGQAA